MKKIGIVLVLALGFFISLPSDAQEIYVQYRGSVNVSACQSVDVSRSSLVTNLWYCNADEYLIIGLGGTNYHYCRVPESVFDILRQANSVGRAYNSFVKGNYDCRLGGIPKLNPQYRDCYGCTCHYECWRNGICKLVCRNSCGQFC